MIAQSTKRILLPVAALLLVMIGLGLLITKAMRHAWPFTVEDGLNRTFAGERTDAGNAITLFWSFVGSTPAIIAVTALVAIILRVKLHRWREPLFLCAAVPAPGAFPRGGRRPRGREPLFPRPAVRARATVFFFPPPAPARPRPAVRHLDDSPPPSSFPSGHTSAAVALYCGLAVVLAL